MAEDKSLPSVDDEEFDDEEIELELEDEEEDEDLPENDSPPKRDADDTGEDEEEEEDEFKKYGKRAQKRIQKLVAQNKEREAQLAEMQQRMEALESQTSEFETKTKTYEEQTLNQFEERLKAELSDAKRAYREAYDNGDVDAQIEAQERIAQANAQKVNLDAYRQHAKAQTPPKKKADKSESEPEVKQTPAPQEQELDPVTKRWVKRNSKWFRKDNVLTATAFGIHNELLEEGYDPGDPDDDEFGVEAYYKELDERLWSEAPKRMEQYLGSKTETSKKRSTGKTASPARGTAGTKPKKKSVKLTASEAGMAKRLGITPEQYAKEKYKKMKEQGAV